jgi:hypothetical protein
LTYAALVRESLQASRSAGLDFPEARAVAMEAHPVEDEDVGPHDGKAYAGTWAAVLPFLEKHMRDAYTYAPLSRGLKPMRLVPLGESTEAVSGRYTRPEGGRTSLERSAERVG